MQADFRAFCQQHIGPYADEWDMQQKIPAHLPGLLAERGYLGAFLPKEIGGLGGDLVTFGLLNEEVGAACSSVRSLLTVHGMVCYALQRWGGAHRQSWLPRLASGQALAAFALSEPDCGSDAQKLATFAQLDGDHYRLNGTKKWVTFGQLADVFLVFTQSERGLLALLVERQAPGLEIKPLSDMLGTRASMLAELHLRECRVPVTNQVGGPGFGLAAVAMTALELGRYSVAWGCVGILQACRRASLDYAAQRRQFGKELRDHQLISCMLTNIIVETRAARALCLEAGQGLLEKDPQATSKILTAKYFASRAATRAALDAIQIHGANGCSSQHSVGRYLRDAKIMEIIEGSNEMQQLMIAEQEYQQS